MCEHLGRCSVPSAYNTSAGSAAHSHHDLNERMRRGRGNWISRPPDLNRGNGKHQSDRNQATGRKLQVGQLDSRLPDWPGMSDTEAIGSGSAALVG